MTTGHGAAAQAPAGAAGVEVEAAAAVPADTARVTASTAAAEVRRWKIVALVSAFVAVAMVAGGVGWLLRGEPDARPTAFTGGGSAVAYDCVSEIGGITVDSAQILVYDGAGKEIASSRLMAAVPQPNTNLCRRSFVIDRIPGGLGIYMLQVGRWKQPVTEAALRSNVAEILLAG
jgi:hypothetical protein